MKHIAPALNQKSFHCPNCGVLSEQTWSENIQCNYNGRLPNGANGNTQFYLQNFQIAKCRHCEQPNIWLSEKMIYPLTGNVEMANQDLPDDIKNDYNEAKNIVNIIAEMLISQPKKVKEYYEKHIPEGLRIAIEKRDSK